MSPSRAPRTDRRQPPSGGAKAPTKAAAGTPTTGGKEGRRDLRRRLPALFALLVVVFAVSGYLLFIPGTKLAPRTMAQLLPSKGQLPELAATPAYSAPISIVPSTLSLVTKAAKNDPGHTGAYSLQWLGTTKTANNEGFVLYLLPDVATAEAVLVQQEQQYTSAKALAPSKVNLHSRFLIPGVPPSEGGGVSIVISAAAGGSSSGATTHGYIVVQREGRAVVREQIEGPAVTTAQAISLAREVHGLLVARLPTFPSMASTVYPTLASLYYGLVTLSLLLVALFGPGLYRRQQALRRAKEAERALYQYRVRGAKHLKRRTRY